jgi:sugar phosphate isomerase/epimerase
MELTRRDFVQAGIATASVAAMSSLGILGARAAEPKHKIKRGVATYSYQEDFLVKQMSVEDMFREMSDIGAYGFECLAEMMIPDFPSPSNAFIDQWHGWVDEYQLVPCAYTQFIDSMRTKHHVLTVEEGVQTMLRDIRLAKLLGIPKIRCLIGTPVDILEATLPYLEKNDIWIGVELHAPIKINGPLMARLLKVAEKSDRFGFVPDFGIFQNAPNPFLRDRLIRDGLLTHPAALYIENAWENHVDQAKVVAEVVKMKGPATSKDYVQTVYGITTQDARDLIPIMSKCRHIHGKTWGLTEDCVDPSIDLTPVIPALIKGGYDGIIATEYEGQRMVDDIMPFSAMEMVRRHHVMQRRLLGEI